MKKSILQRGNVVANKWRRTALLAKLKNAASSNSADETDGRPSSKIGFVDVARLAMADRNSNAPSEDEGAGAKL